MPYQGVERLDFFTEDAKVERLELILYRGCDGSVLWTFFQHACEDHVLASDKLDSFAEEGFALCNFIID
jgi:hypothetical protein